MYGNYITMKYIGQVNHDNPTHLNGQFTLIFHNVNEIILIHINMIKCINKYP